MNVNLISTTESFVDNINTPEDLIVYCARVSNPSNQLNTATSDKLISYLVRHKHWSPFEMVDLCFEIETSRAISAQILRHSSLQKQEFSQRYSNVQHFESIELRKQSEKNRQSSEQIVLESGINTRIQKHIEDSQNLYNDMIEKGIAREQARMILPLSTQTRLYVKGNVRSWLSFLNVRLHKDSQKEIRLIAEEIKKYFIEILPNISKSFNNFEDSYESHFM